MKISVSNPCTLTERPSVNIANNYSRHLLDEITNIFECNANLCSFDCAI